MKSTLLIVFLFLFVCGCKKDSKAPTTGEVTLSSQKFGTQTFYVYGFSVSAGSLVQFSLGTASQYPDWVLEEILDVAGIPTGVNITTNSSNTLAFCLNGSYANITEATSAFAAYREVAFSNSTDKILDIKPFQIYTYKNKSLNYTKFLIENLEIKNSGTTTYYEATIQWVYQPDGSTHFSE